ncbi:MAG: YgiT-type zinc finger protein [Acidobacteria bacterium]|nr:YgiT-type zinc finger protein [Acidobacteriota bacterium]MBI3657776.1 YgiT-type zinc finger protein [Acidobacteriota bacterium]
MIKITICPSCGSKRIKKRQRNWIGRYEGKTYVVPNLEYYECPDCAEKVYDRRAMKRIETHSPAIEKSRLKKKLA